MAKFKVLHVVNSLDPGGMENGVVNMIWKLRDDFQFKVACLERAGKFSERLPDPGQVKILGKKGGFSPNAVLELALEISRFKPDAIHTHNLGPLIYASLATMGGFTKPIVHGEHSQLTGEELTSRRIRQRHLLYKCCRKVHTVSYSQREELLANGFSSISTVVNGVDTERFLPGSNEAAKGQLGFQPDEIVMGIVGRFGPFKRHSVLLESFNAIANDFPKLQLLIVGAGGPEESRVKEQVQQSVWKNRIRLVGYQKEPVDFYQAMDFLIVPSLNEGLSNAVLEAKACGIPVLAHTACGNEEVIENGCDGIIADLATKESIAIGVKAFLVQRNHFPVWSSNARERAVRLFSMESMTQAYRVLYQSVLVKTRKGFHSL